MMMMMMMGYNLYLLEQKGLVGKEPRGLLLRGMEPLHGAGPTSHIN